MNDSNSQYSPASSSTPSIVSKTNYQFVKSPLVLFAISAYTIYTAIAVIQSIPNLEYLDDCFDILTVSPLLAVVVFCALILFIAPIIITVGLWNMYNSGGSNGASTVCSGIRTYVTLFITAFVCALLFVFIEYDALEYADDVLEESFLPIAYIIFSMIAISSMCNFALAVESTTVRRKANVDGVSRAGVQMLVFCVL